MTVSKSGSNSSARLTKKLYLPQISLQDSRSISISFCWPILLVSLPSLPQAFPYLPEHVGQRSEWCHESTDREHGEDAREPLPRLYWSDQELSEDTSESSESVAYARYRGHRLPPMIQKLVLANVTLDDCNDNRRTILEYVER